MFFGRQAALLAALSLGGCVGIYGGAFGQDVVGNAAYVTVSNVWNEMDALPLADQHCAQYGKVARFSSKEGHRVVYDCVKAE